MEVVEALIITMHPHCHKLVDVEEAEEVPMQVQAPILVPQEMLEETVEVHLFLKDMKAEITLSLAILLMVLAVEVEVPLRLAMMEPIQAVETVETDNQIQ